MNQNEAHFKQVINRYRELLTKSRNKVGAIAIELYDESFDKQGQIMGGGTIKPWAKRGFSPPSKTGRKTLINRGRLRRGSYYRKAGKSRVELINNTTYAAIHNDGGTIQVTAKMRRFFWAMVYKYWQKGVTYDIATRSLSNRKKDQKFGPEAEFWFKMAMAKKIEIPKRPIFYDTPELPNRLDAYFLKAIENIFKQAR
jgi:phage gpG-like protein